MPVFSKSMAQNSLSAETQTCKSLPFSYQEQDQQGNLKLVSLTGSSSDEILTMSRYCKSQATHESMCLIFQKWVLNCGNKKRGNKPWGCKGPSQCSQCCHSPSEQKDWPDAARWRTKCYIVKTDTQTTLHWHTFLNKCIYSPLPSLEDFAQTPISWSTRRTTTY